MGGRGMPFDPSHTELVCHVVRRGLELAACERGVTVAAVRRGVEV